MSEPQFTPQARQVYAFAGRRGSGKSTASSVLLERGYLDIKFADPLKNMMRALYRTCGVDDETIERKLEGDLKEAPCVWLQGKTPRYAMQKLGTEWRNMIGAHMWSDILIARVNALDEGVNVVCSDYRFPGHEAAALERLNAVRVRIERPRDSDGDAYGQHASETQIDNLPVDAVFENVGTVEDLLGWVNDLIAASEGGAA